MKWKKKNTHLSNHFHCRYRWKYIDMRKRVNGSLDRNVFTTSAQATNNSRSPESKFRSQNSKIAFDSCRTSMGSGAWTESGKYGLRRISQFSFERAALNKRRKLIYCNIVFPPFCTFSTWNSGWNHHFCSFDRPPKPQNKLFAYSKNVSSSLFNALHFPPG